MQAEHVAASAVLGVGFNSRLPTSDSRLVLARDVRAGAAAARLACVRHLGRGERVRAVARDAACRLKPSSTAPRSGRRRHAERRYPWGDSVEGRPPANFDFQRWDPQPVGVHPDGVSAFGVHDLVGNGWEWTSTVFAPFDGFAPLASYPEYSADFFDGDHYVMKGASPVTARALVRPGFRNWFRPRYPYVYATFRTAGATAGSA